MHIEKLRQRLLPCFISIDNNFNALFISNIVILKTIIIYILFNRTVVMQY